MNNMLLQKLDGRRIFADERIQSAVDSAVAELGPETNFAVVGHGVYDSHGNKRVSASVVVRLPAGFSVAAAAYKDFALGDHGVEGKVIWKG